MTTASFKATLNRPEAQGTATFLEVPLDVPAIFGRARPPVWVTINGHTYRATIAVYGNRYYLPVNRNNRQAAGVEAGDTVTVEIELDTHVRQVSVPDDLQAALANDPAAADEFQRLSYTHQREHVVWIEAAERAETRARRITQTLERLHRGQQLRR
jgi:hypothetical protein